MRACAWQVVAVVMVVGIVQAGKMVDVMIVVMRRPHTNGIAFYCFSVCFVVLGCVFWIAFCSFVFISL